MDPWPLWCMAMQWQRSGPASFSPKERLSRLMVSAGDSCEARNAIKAIGALASYSSPPPDQRFAEIAFLPGEKSNKQKGDEWRSQKAPLVTLKSVPPKRR